jgi:hypothetical protein
MSDRICSEDIDAIAYRVVELIRPKPEQRLVKVKELAEELGVHPNWVYRHKEKLGFRRLGGNTKGELRFDLKDARERAASLFESCQPPRGQTARRGRPRKVAAPGVPLIRGRSAR